MRARAVGLFALYVVVSIVTRLLILGADIANGDEASYVVGAWELLRGGIPYTTFVDNKPPLIYIYYALAQLIGGHGILSVRLLTVLVTVPLTAFGVSAFYRHDRRGVIGALVFLIVGASYTASDMLAVNCEIVMMLPLAWAAVALRDAPTSRGRTFAAGALVGIAVLIKYQAIFWLPAFGIALSLEAWRRSRVIAFKQLSTLLLGAAVPIGVLFVVFASVGGVEGLWYWNVTHNIGYVMNPTTVREALLRATTKVAPFVLVTIVLWIGSAKTLASKADSYRRTLVGGLLGMSAVACVLGMRFFPHYFVQLYVPLSLGAAPWLAGLLVRPFSAPARAVMAYTGLIFAGFTVVNARMFVLTTPAINTRSHELSARLQRDPCYDGASLFIWGSAPTLYYHAQLTFGARYFFPEFPLVPYYAGNRPATTRHAPGLFRERRVRHWQWLMSDLRQNAPTYIVDTAPAQVSMWEYFPLADYPMLADHVDRHYAYLDTVSDMRIYRRNACADTMLVSRRF